MFIWNKKVIRQKCKDSCKKKNYHSVNQDEFTIR